MNSLFQIYQKWAVDVIRFSKGIRVIRVARIECLIRAFTVDLWYTNAAANVSLMEARITACTIIFRFRTVRVVVGK